MVPILKHISLVHSVLVQAGDINNGHYYSYLRNAANKWFRFDDERVTPAVERQVLEENYGILQNARTIRDYKRVSTTAYMLIYIRKRDIPWVLNAVDAIKDIPEHLST